MYQSTKIIELGSCAFRQPKAKSHCRHLHGYRLVAKLWFNSETLDENNWVMDFGGLKDLKVLLESIFDHTLVVDAKDPQLDLFRQLAAADAAQIVIMDGGVGIEKFAKKVYDVANNFVSEKTNNRVSVSKVEVWEHEKNSAIYTDEIPITEAVIAPIAIPKTGITPTANNTLESPLHAEEIKLEVPPVPQVSPESARVGNKVSTGWSNPFGGTSWGA